LGYVVAEGMGHQIASLGEFRDPALRVVSVGGQHVDRFTFEQPCGYPGDTLPPEASECVGGDLDDAAEFHPFEDALWILAKDVIALGMRDHGGDAAVAEFQEAVGDLHGDAVIAQFDKQIARAVDGVALGGSEDVLQVVVRKVEVTAQAEFGNAVRKSAQAIECGGVGFAIVGVSVVGVGCGDDVSDAVGGRHAAHLNGDVPGFGAIVDFGEDMAVDIDHRWPR